MRKLIAVGVLFGGLLAWAGVASAAPLAGQGGVGDPLQLAASGVVLPYIQGGPNGLKALVEVASPVGSNCITGSGPSGKCTSGPDLHLIFFLNDCSRQVSVPLPETENDISFVDPNSFTAPNSNGLVTIGGLPAIGTALIPMQNAIHSRVYEFNPSDGRSRVLEPIIIDSAEFGSSSPTATLSNAHLWSPLRTGATFYAPFEGLDSSNGLNLNTQLTFICPRDTIQGSSGAPFGLSIGTAGSFANYTTTGFPQIDPPFWTFSAATGPTSLGLSGEVYDINEGFLADISFGCDCLSPDVGVNSLTKSGTTYSSPAALGKGTYTEIWVTQPSTWPAVRVPVGFGPAGAFNAGSFTAYRDVFSAGSALNKFFGRTSNGSYGWLQGVRIDSR